MEDEYQEVEITIKGKIKMPTAPKLLEVYGSADVLERVIELWSDNPNHVFEIISGDADWFLVSVEKVHPAVEPSLIEHVKKTL